MAEINWKLVVGLLIGLVVILSAGWRLTRSVPVYTPTGQPPTASWGTLDAESAQALQAILDENVNALKVPGLQAYVRTAEGATWSGASGTTDLGRRQLLQRDQVLRIGSVTKTFTAVLVLKLVEAEKLSLDEPVARWFPDLPSADRITVRHLLNHSSGLPEFIPKVLVKSILPSTYWETPEILALIAQDQPLFEPGSRFEYSNTNYILLGSILEQESGKPVVELLHEQIIDPLAIEHTYFIPYEAAPANLAPGYDLDLSHFPGMLDISPQNTSWATAAFTSGALASTAGDLGIFYESLFAGKLLSPASLEAMTAFIPASNPGFSAQDGSGLGLMRLQVGGEELVGHVGQFMGATAIAMVSPEKHDTVVVVCNLSFPDLLKILAELREKTQ